MWLHGRRKRKSCAVQTQRSQKKEKCSKHVVKFRTKKILFSQTRRWFMSAATDGKIRVAGLREAYQSILTERPKGFSCIYKRLKSFLKTDRVCVCVLVCVCVGRLSQARCWCLLELVAFTFAELCLCPDVYPEAGRSSVGVWFHSDTDSASTWKPGHLRGEAACLADSRRSCKGMFFFSPPHMLCYLSAVRLGVW